MNGNPIVDVRSPSVSGQNYSPVPTTEPGRPTRGVQHQNLMSSTPAPAYMTASSQNSPEPSQTDLQGHYIGPASGVSFLLRIQKRLHQAISFTDPNSIFTFGDAPLHPPEFDPSFCMMLPREDAQRLVNRYFDFAMPTYRFLHRPTVQKWFTEFYDTLGIMRNPQSAPAKIALLFIVFAQGRVYMPDNDRPGPPDLQNRRPDITNGLSPVEAECRRRTFWCAYTLDTYLSVALGRPRSFHDDDIDTELPACVEDDEITSSRVNMSTSSKSQSTMLASIAHIKLARIISKILRDLYSIKPISANRRAVLTERVSKDLSDWRVDLSRFLDADCFTTSLLMPISQRQRNVLNLTYWHAIILTHRPFLLTNFTRLSQQSKTTVEGDLRIEESVQQCLTAAMNTVNTIDEMTQNGQILRSFWTTAYFAFTANIVLYIYVIQKRASPPETYAAYFAAATRCQTHISSIAEKGSLSERYCLVLEELRNEAIRQTERIHHPMTAVDESDGQAQQNRPQSTAIPLDGQLGASTDYTDLTADPTIDFSDIPESAISDYSGWGQFASMVSSGLGNLDVFFNDDPFKL
ncbi:hypothetical protein HRR78_001664 [Exophiala dermatitidis]|nr:hypothetical protein HRR78_001664 [Exophiala dermatitidis]